ncbi:AP-3 complex subunit delta-1-like isoform X1 [Argonauta hians]
MALKKVKGTLERVLDKNLQDLVRGIRNHKENEAKYIAECLDEIKQELRQDNMAVKSNAVNKLTYLQMLGYDISWAAFNIIEVMSSSKFTFKRIGYLAASQSFHEGTDVLMLTTNMIRKDLNSQSMYDSGVALNGLACFISQDLSRDLANDIMTLMTSTRPYLRKKAVLIMYKVFLQFPEALRPAFPRLKEKLEDPDPGVQSAAVNVICELARKNPKNYLSLAPLFFKLMTSSTNNWVLIKIIKLFGALTPLEPRLGKKLIEPLTNLIHSTSAMSLLYECINTVIAVLISISTGVPNHSASIQLCVQKLRILIEDSDQNLKYLGLLAMSKILATHPKSVQAHKDLILQCLDDKDESIRLRALDLLYGMVSKKNLMEIVKKLMIHMDKAEGSHYRDELLSKIIEICSQSNYQYVLNFEWYVSILVELTRMEGTRHGKLIASQMLDVAIRVQTIRDFAVQQMAVLLDNSHVLASNSQRNGICEVLYAAAWICGEFSEYLKDPKSTLEAMLRPKITALPGHIQSVYVQNLVKLYSNILKKAEEEEDDATMKETGQMLLDKLPMFIQSADLEVQERACCVLQLVKYVMKLQEKGNHLAEEIACLYEGYSNAAALHFRGGPPQTKRLDLDRWINEIPSDSSDEEIRGTSLFTPTADDHKSYKNDVKKIAEPTEEELERRREQRRIDQMHNPHYLKDDGKGKGKRYESISIEDIPVADIDLSVPLHVPGLSSSDKYLKLGNSVLDGTPPTTGSGKKSKKTKRKRDRKGQRYSDTEEEEADSCNTTAVSTVMDMPEGAHLSDKDDDDKNADDPHRKLNIDLDEPLRDDEKLPVRTHHVVLDYNNLDEVGIDPLDMDKPKKKSKKEKDKSKKKKKERKVSKKELRSVSFDGNQVNGETETNIISAGVQQSLPLQLPAEDPQAQHEDLEFWLSTGDISAAHSRNQAKIEAVNSTLTRVQSTDSKDGIHLTNEKQKKKKEKRTKERKKEKKKKVEGEEKNRSEYEEAEGVATPSKEYLPPSEQPEPVKFDEATPPPMSSYRRLAGNDSLKMVYETRVSQQRSDQIVISVIFTNQSSNHIKDIEFNVLNTLNARLIRAFGSDHDPVKVPFLLLPNSQNEGQFAFNIQNITMPQKMKGTLTYIIKTAEGSTHEKLDFKICFPCSSYLMATQCKGSSFASLLSNGQLSAKTSAKIELPDEEFPQILAKLCFYLHFTIVEQVAHSASLYSKSIQDHHVCLLVKYLPNQQLNVDAKSSESMLLTNIIDDIRAVLTVQNQ